MKFLHSLAGRLTLWYAGVFSLCFLAVFGAFYMLMHNHFDRWTDAQLKEEVVEVNVAYDKDGPNGIVQQLKVEEASEGGRFMGRLIDGEGRVTFETAPGYWSGVGINHMLVTRARSGLEDVEKLELDAGHPVRVIYSRFPDGSVVQIGLALLEHEIWMRRFARDLAKVALLALVLSVGAGSFMARRALSPICEMAQTAAAISGRSMGQRVPVSGCRDEVDQLARSFNAMLDRIDTLVEGVRNVTDNVAHDIRTPISGIRGMAEVTLRSQREPSAYRAALYQIIEQLDLLLSLSNTILDVAEAESGALSLRLETVALDNLVIDIVQTFEPVATAKGIDLEAKVSPGIRMEGDKGRLGQMLANLLDNAIKYTPHGGRIRLFVEPGPAPRGVAVTVTDTGTGICEKDLPHIFERYYRGDKSRSEPGVGLGLPLVQGIVKAHGGHVTVESRPGKGSVFRVFLPYNPMSASASFPCGRSEGLVPRGLDADLHDTP